MWLRCRNTLSGHEASIPVDLVQSLTDWTPIEGAEPSDTFADATYNASPDPVDQTGSSTPPADQSGNPDKQGV